jgi:hypothetical protein
MEWSATASGGGRSVEVWLDLVSYEVAFRFGTGEEGRTPKPFGVTPTEFARQALVNYDALYPYASSKTLLL